HTAKDVWQQSYPAGSIVLRSEDPNLTGVVEPDGKVTVMDLRTQKEVLKVPAYDPKDPWKGIDPKQLGKETQITVLKDAQQFYLAFFAANETGGGPWPAVLNGSGLRSLPLNGKLYAFEMDTGAYKWYVNVPNQMILLDHFEDLPIVLCTARYNKGPA